jgi:chemotaxis protein methyltransferase CheR
MKTESACATAGGPSTPRRGAGCPANVLSEVAYERFRLLARERIGLEFTGARRPDLERAVARTVAELRLPSDDALYQLLTASGDGRIAFDRLAAELTVCETHFFRNRPQFEALERHILPELIRQRRPSRRLRLWSAGCATGEEPYSLAILVRRLLPDLADWDVLILATDVNRDVLARAGRGVFGGWSFREVPADIQRTCFERVGSQWEILPQIRDLVTFAHLNMVQGGYPAPASNTHDMDLILCRNMLIYFDEQTTQRVVGRLYTALTDGGWLVVGHAEPSLTTFRQFATRNFPGTVVYQKVAHEGPQPVWGTAVEELTQRRQDAEVAGGTGSSLETRQVPGTSEVPGTWRAVFKTGAPRPISVASKRPSASEPLEPETLALYRAAKTAADQSRFADARLSVEAAIQRSPLWAPAHYLHGLILQEEGDLEQALAALRRCVYADARFVLGHLALAGLYAVIRQPERARVHRENAARLLREHTADDLIPEGDGLTGGQLLRSLQV